MIKIKRILCIALMFCFIGSYVYGYTYEPLSEEKLKNNLEETYGINIIIPENEEYKSYRECLLILHKGLKRFPQGVIKEITDYYSINGISTNIILGKAEKISDLFSEYNLDEKTAELYINKLESNLYNESCSASELGFVHEMGHYVSDYMFKIYGYEKIKSQFEKMNAGYAYGTWGDGYDYAFVNKHSAMSFEEDIADLIWHSEVNPDDIRNIGDGNYTVIHKKIEYLASIINQCFSNVTDESKLWSETLPQKPEKWAMDSIKEMNDASLIPEEFEGIYNSYISKEDFYILALNIIENKLDRDNSINSLELNKQDNFVTIDPIKGEIYVDKGPVLDLEMQEYNEIEKRLLKANEIGIIDEGWLSGSTDNISRLEIARLFNYISNKAGMDISDYEVFNYADITNVNDTDKTFIYYVSSKGLLNGDGENFKPHDYCTYQEAYVILMRLYNLF
ncbi:MAG: hypothetical protein K0R07_1655 [Sedimentibacter sp.]|jgi:hypothetical protein|nr:hypothetical protein [Sedimentibacter sp.]